MIVFGLFFITLIFGIFYDSILQTFRKIVNKLRKWIGGNKAQKVPTTSLNTDIEKLGSIKMTENTGPSTEAILNKDSFYDCIGLQGILNEQNKSKKFVQDLEAHIKQRNETSHKVKKLHHKYTIKIAQLEKALEIKQQELSKVLQNVFSLKTYLKKDSMSKVVKKEEHDKKVYGGTNFPTKMQDVPTYDMEENDTLKEIFDMRRRLDRIKYEMNAMIIDDPDSKKAAKKAKAIKGQEDATNDALISNTQHPSNLTPAVQNYVL